MPPMPMNPAFPINEQFVPEHLRNNYMVNMQMNLQGNNLPQLPQVPAFPVHPDYLKH